MSSADRGVQPSSSGSSDVGRMARGGGLNLMGAVVGQAALLGVITLIGHTLGTAAVGRYSVLYAMLTLLSLLSLAGFRAGLTRFVAIFLADDDSSRVRGTIRLGVGVTIGASLVISTALALFAPTVARLYDNPALESGIRWIALALPAASFADAALAATQGWRSQREFALIGRIGDPLGLLAFTALFISLGWGVDGAIIALPASAWATAIVAAFALARRVRRVPAARAIMPARRIFSFSMVSWGSALAQTGLVWAGTLVLGAMASEEDVGVFSIAARLVSLAVFVMAPIINSFSPHVAHLHHREDREGVSDAYGSATRWIVQLSAPAFVLLLLIPGPLLRALGESTGRGAWVVVILALGQMVSAAAGPCGVVLNMSGRVGLSLIDNVGVLALNLALNVALIPKWGIIGAAIAWSAALIVGNLVKVAQVRYILGVTARRPALIRTLGIGAVAFAVGWAATHIESPWWGTILLVGSAVGLTYLVLLLWIGLDPQDRAIGRALRRRIPRPSGRSQGSETPSSKDDEADITQD